MWLALCEKLSIKPESTNRSITVSMGEHSNVVGSLRDVPVKLDTLAQQMDSLVGKSPI